MYIREHDGLISDFSVVYNSSVQSVLWRFLNDSYLHIPHIRIMMEQPSESDAGFGIVDFVLKLEEVVLAALCFQTLWGWLITCCGNFCLWNSMYTSKTKCCNFLKFWIYYTIYRHGFCTSKKIFFKNNS